MALRAVEGDEAALGGTRGAGFQPAVPAFVPASFVRICTASSRESPWPYGPPKAMKVGSGDAVCC